MGLAWRDEIRETEKNAKMQDVNGGENKRRRVNGKSGFEAGFRHSRTLHSFHVGHSGPDTNQYPSVSITTNNTTKCKPSLKRILLLLLLGNGSTENEMKNRAEY